MASTEQVVQHSSVFSPDQTIHNGQSPPLDSHLQESGLVRTLTASPAANATNPFVEVNPFSEVNPSVRSNSLVKVPVTNQFAYRQTATEAYTARPSLLHFRAPPYICVESWDYTALFYDDELMAGDQLCDRMDTLLLQPIDLSRHTVRRLQQSFVENFLRWTPIFDQQTCIQAVEQAMADGFSKSDASTCLVFFLLALGAVSEERNENLEEQTPGLDYFSRGSPILEKLSLRTGSLQTLQCRILQASYFRFAMYPLQAWNSITQAGRDCMHILSSRMMHRMLPAEQEAMNRAFWSTSTMLHELEATMKMHPIGLRQFHETVPLPRAEEEESSSYYFLAQISLRKFLTQSLEVVGYHSGRVIYAPVVTKELRQQIREWYVNHVC
jgi:hypothetical protein